MCKTGEDLRLTAIASATARDAVADADIAPLVGASWLKPGAFAAITDFLVPWVLDSIAKFERIIIDDEEQEASMPSPLVKPELVAGDLSGLVLGEVAGRGDDAERTAFIFRAHPLGDLALAALAYKKAVQKSLGTPIGA